MDKKKTSGTGRTRNFATIVYPDSAPSDWLRILGEECVPCFVSPLHDQDLNPTGEPKKAHYHVMFMFDGVKTQAQVKEITDKIGGVGLKVLNSARAYARYLCHLDNPDKVEYSKDDVIQFGGLDYHLIIGLMSDKYTAVREMTDFIRINQISSFAQIFDYASAERSDWFRCLCDSSAYVIKEYIKSKHWENKNFADYQ